MVIHIDLHSLDNVCWLIVTPVTSMTGISILRLVQYTEAELYRRIDLTERSVIARCVIIHPDGRRIERL